MAEAIARGLIKAGVLQPAEMIAADPEQGRRDLFEHMRGLPPGFNAFHACRLAVG